MWKATIRGLLARRLRLVLTALAIVIGVGFMTATYVLTDSVKQSFDEAFAQTVSGVDLVVQGPKPLGDSGEPERIPEATLDQARSVPGVAGAQGFVIGQAQFVGKDGDDVKGGGPPTLGVSWAPGPMQLVDDGVSRAPRGPGEVLMDAGTARAEGFSVGDRVRVLLDGPAQAFRIVGLFGFGTRDDFGRVSFAAFDLPTAQRVLEAEGLLDRVYVQREPNVPPEVLRERLSNALGAPYEVLTQDEARLEVGRPVRQFLGFFTAALLGFAAIGVLVAALIIFNTFTILVTQRTRELGLLRALGATGDQVVRSVVLEALVVGALATALGIAVGVALGAGLLALLEGLELGPPDTGTVLLARTVVVAGLVGVVVTALAGTVPALRAARIPPMAAIDGTGSRVPGRPLRRLLAGAAVLAAGVGVTVLGMIRSREVTGLLDQVQVVAIGAFGVVVGVMMLLASVARPLAGVLGRPLRWLGTSGVLARANAMRNPRRTAVTASALVIGLTLVGFTATFGESAKASVEHDTGEGLRADLVVKSDGFTGFSSDVAARLESLPELRAVVPFRFADARVDGLVKTVGSADPADLDAVVRLDFVDGGVGKLDADDGGVLVSDELADELDLRVGDLVPVDLTYGTVAAHVQGIYRRQNFVGLFGQTIPMIVPREAVAVGSTDHLDSLVLVRADDVRAARRAIDRELGNEFPNVDVLTKAEFQADQREQVDQFLTVLVAILALSALVAILGIVNTLALSVFERTRELGLLRTVGMTRPQVRSMVRGESVVIAVLGGVVGSALGLLIGWVFSYALRAQGISVFKVPVAELAVFLVGSMLAGVLAAVVPAWRAGRLDVLDAIATE
jgi:putative ABC transport system permease protein